MIRTFIGVRFPVLNFLQRVLSDLSSMGRAVKPVSADNLHVTLKFLGDTDPMLVPKIAATIDESIKELSMVEVQVMGMGAFPNIARPSVVWAGLQNAEVLADIKSQLDHRLEPLGFQPEKREFTPHLTLARVRSRPPNELRSFILENQKAEFGYTTVRSVNLFQSELTPAGPKYSVLSSSALLDGGI